MDRGLLSDQSVIEASRDFVCIRTATYEDAIEAEFHRATLFGGSATLRNFGYALLSPDAKTKLRQSGRGPNFIYKNAKEMAAELKRIAGKYPYKTKTTQAQKTRSLPKMKGVRLGLNVASCDGLPLIIVVGKSAREVAQLSKNLGEVAWSDALIGRFIYASTHDATDLSIIMKAKIARGFLVVEPGEFGLEGVVIQAIDAKVSGGVLQKRLLDIAEKFRRLAKVHRTHVRKGRRTGHTWETEVPVPKRRRR
jgi:hypothetical protein